MDHNVYMIGYICMAAINVVLALLILHQRVINAKYEKIISQNLTALKQANTVLKAATHAREQAAQGS